MADSLNTGLELELLLPVGMGRLELLALLQPIVGGRVESFEMPSKVPVPLQAAAGLEGDAATSALMAAMQDVARHHQARLHSIAPDARHFFLAHRCGRLVDAQGSCLLSVVHDNTIAGGERVAEVVTPPFGPDRLGWLRGLVESLAAIPGIALPEAGALHVHVDGRCLCDAAALARLVALYLRLETRLRRWLRTPATARSAQPLAAALLPALQQIAGQSWPEARAALAPLVRDRGCGLNLYNLLHQVDDKFTVELKLAAASLDPDWVLAVRALFLRLVAMACDSRLDLSCDDAALLRLLDPAAAIFAQLEPTLTAAAGRA